MHAYVKAAVERELGLVRTASKGARGTVLFKAAAALGGLVGSGLVRRDVVQDCLVDAARETELPMVEIRAHVRRGLSRGAETPRQIPGRREVSVPLPPTARVTARPARPLAGVRALWDTALPVTQHAATAEWILTRGLDPEAVELWDLARAIPADAKLPPWAWTKAGGPWTKSGHDLIVRVWNAMGACGALRARAIREPAKPAKSLAPTGACMAGLVMACPLGIQVLAGQAPEWWRDPSFVITEGEPDFMT